MTARSGNRARTTPCAGSFPTLPRSLQAQNRSASLGKSPHAARGNFPSPPADSLDFSLSTPYPLPIRQHHACSQGSRSVSAPAPLLPCSLPGQRRFPLLPSCSLRLTLAVTCNIGGMSDRKGRLAARVRAHRARLREQGLRPVQIWVPDVRAPQFATAAHAQSAAVAASDQADDDQAFIDAISWDAEPE